ncbi:MAG TPA: putative Ig domain-containing protein, partial [Leptospiraceae bacterium]|nr:putative Ig domain-containing protein [Leptospiraceae bacterium]
MKWIINVFMIFVLFSIVDCSGIKKKAEEKWKAVAAYLFLNKAPSKVSMNISLVGADGKSITVGNTSVREASSVSSESEKPSENSSAGAPGSAGQKAGGETLNLDLNGAPKAVEVLDSNGNYAGTITVTPRTGDETYTNSFLSFALRSDSEPAAGAVQGVITGEVIITEVPFQDLTKLSAVFTIDGEKVRLEGADQVTGKTVNDFSQNRTFTVTAKNGTEKKYTVITKKKYYTCELAGLYFTDYPLTAVRQNSDASSVWYEAVLPPDADVSSLKTSFSVYGTSVKIGSNVQISGQSLNSFSSPVTFTVSGSNGCTADYTVKVSKENLAAGKNLKKGRKLTRSELELVDFPEITKIGAVGIPKTVSTLELKPYGYFDDVTGQYVFTKGQVILMVPYGTLFDNINLEVETKNNTKKVSADGKDYSRGNTFVKFMQRNGSEKYTVDAVLTDKYSAFEVPYEIQIVMGAPPPFVAVSKDSTFMLFVNSTAASTRDESNELAEIIRWFAPFYNAGSAISDLKTVLAKVNEVKISVARWTVDPGKVDLNIIGQGFKGYDFDVESYEEDLKCFKYPYAVYESDSKFRWGADELYYYANLETIHRNMHKEYCGKSKGNETYPSYVKKYPRISSYGRILNNAKTVEGYGIKAEDLNQEMDSAFFAKTLTSEVPKMNQNGSAFYLQPVRGEKVLYELPAVNYIEKMEPNNGTVGTEVLVTFAAPLEDNTYTISCTMDNTPVLNLKVRDSRSVYFNVPNISKGTRIACEKMPLSPTKGVRFVMISTEAFRMKPYTPLADLSFPSSEAAFTVDERTSIQGSVKQGRISYCWLSSGKLPYGLYLDGRCRISGKLVAEEPASELTVIASDGYQQSSFRLKIGTKPAVIIKPPTVNYPAAGYFLLVGKKFSISPISEKVPGVQYSINRPLPTGVTFDRETGTVSGYPVDTMSSTTYIISAANETGFAKYSLTLQINPDKTGFSPPSLSFSAGSYSVTKDQPVTLTPTVTGSQPFEFSASGLPDGMSVDQDTGVISGTPLSLASDAKAYVTVKNYAG